MTSEYSIINGNNNKTIIVSFGGMALQMGGIPPFEFLNYLKNNYTSVDLLFYIDKQQCWYHNGIENISNNIEETVIYLSSKIKKYSKVIFMGVSAGGYAAILFGSLCKINTVIAFIPQTIIINPINNKYSNLKEHICKNIQYILYGDISTIDNNHHILHCNNLQEFKNVNIIKKDYINMKELRDNNELLQLLNTIIK